MGDNRINSLIRSLTTSRRLLLGGVPGAVFGLHGGSGSRGLAEAEAAKRRKRRRRRKKRQPDPPPDPPHVCEGRDACIDGITASCSMDPNCFCFVTAEGDPYCGKGNGVDSCEQCEQQFPGRDCFPGTGSQCVSFSCVEPCPV
jgi:hypothetical protein